MQKYPLQWPLGYKRTVSRVRSRFEQTYGDAQNFLHAEVKRLQATNLIVSCNLRTRADGLLYANELGRKMEDPGVAIYFQYKGKTVSMCCDKYLQVWENLYALAKGIEAMRGLDRWGVSEFMDRAFVGFNALPAPSEPDWWDVLDLFPGATERQIRDAYRNLAKIHHPERGGNRDTFERITTAYKAALKQ